MKQQTKQNTTSRFCAMFGLIVFTTAMPIRAFSEYVDFIRLESGRETNCALCHINPEGPAGSGAGQLGRLDSLQHNALARARAAMAPGFDVESPILNRFGNAIIKSVGRQQFLDLRRDAQLQKNPLVLKRITTLMDTNSDLDGDGISDIRELLDGTQVMHANHGNPGRLFLANVKRHALFLAVVAAALGLIIFGLGRLLRGLGAAHREQG